MTRALSPSIPVVRLLIFKYATARCSLTRPLHLTMIIDHSMLPRPPSHMHRLHQTSPLSHHSSATLNSPRRVARRRHDSTLPLYPRYPPPDPNLELHSAAASGNVGLVHYALTHGQPVNSVLHGVLPLHAACSGGNVSVVRMLIERGADVNAPRLPRRYSDGKRSNAPSVGAAGESSNFEPRVVAHRAFRLDTTSLCSCQRPRSHCADSPDLRGDTP